jgi:hypothetical protein
MRLIEEDLCVEFSKSKVSLAIARVVASGNVKRAQTRAEEVFGLFKSQ